MNYKTLKSLGLIFASTVMLAACGNNDTVAVKMKDVSISTRSVFQTLLSTTENEQLVQNMFIKRLYKEVYGKHISNKQIDARLTAQANGMSIKELTEKFTDEKYKSLRQGVEENLAFEYGLKDQVPVNDNDLKKLFETYQPDRKVLMYSSTDEATVEKVRNQIKEGASFTDAVKAVTGSAEGPQETVVSFNDGQMPKNLLTAIFKAETKQTSNTLTIKQDENQQPYYLIFEVTDAPKKPEKWTAVKRELKEIYQLDYLSNDTNAKKLISDFLNKQGVRVEDPLFDHIFDDFKTANAKAQQNAKERNNDK